MNDALERCLKILMDAIAETEQGRTARNEEELRTMAAFWMFRDELQLLAGSFAVYGPSALIHNLRTLPDAVREKIDEMKSLAYDDCRATNPRLFFRSLWSRMAASGIRRAEHGAAYAALHAQGRARTHWPLPRRATDASCWETLGLSPDCPSEELTARYRALALQNHPDRGGDEKRMAGINAAFEHAREILRQKGDE